MHPIPLRHPVRLVTLLALALVLGAGLLVISTAQAAPPYETEATETTYEFTGVDGTVGVEVAPSSCPAPCEFEASRATSGAGTTSRTSRSSGT